MTNYPIYPNYTTNYPVYPKYITKFPNYINPDMRISVDGLSPATCPSSIAQGTTRDVTIKANGGTAPYTYKFYVDGVLAKNSGSTPNTTYTFSKTFSETGSVAGTSHEYKAEITDSCSTGNQVKNDICNILITTTTGGTYYNCVSGICQGPYTSGTYPDKASCTTACTANNYGCVNNVCTQNSGTLPQGCNNTCGGVGTTTPCKDPFNLGCTSNIPNTYLAGAGIGTLILLVMIMK